MARFLMLTTREDESLAQNERAAMLHYTGLSDQELVWVRLEQHPLPRIDFERWDGIILCGSRYDVGADEADKSLRQKEIESNLKQLLVDVIARDFPFMGICYGLGLLTQVLGGDMTREYSEDIGAPILTLTSEGLREPILEGIPPRFHAYVGHHEAVGALPNEMIPLIRGKVAPVQMIRIRRNIFATQFHPELDLEGIQFRIEFFADAGYYPAAERPAVEERVLGIDTSGAHRILSNFIDRYGSGPGVA